MSQRELQNFIEQRYQNEIRHHQVLDPEVAHLKDYPDGLNSKLKEVLEQKGIAQLYSHQVEAFESISEAMDTVLVSKTASGKTLSFLLPVLNEYLNAKAPFSVLLLYPTKALSRDQESTLGSLLEAATGKRNMGTFDGDTPREERQRISRQSDFVITNPDMLHSGVLPNHHRRWKSFLSRLRYIIVDEVHSYRGAFGSHVSNVFRRLERVCELHGSSPRVICSSATVGNPGDHVEALFHRPFKVIDNDGSPRPERSLYFINPAMEMSAGDTLYRKGPASISISIIREAAKLGIRTICFCRARQEVERLYRSVTDRHPELAKKIQPYRGGLLPNERRKLERDLFEGRISVILSTNALELGIDIGDLELCILSGHPGSLSSFWQQAGRVGRSGRQATIVFIAKDTPVDQYLVHHPDFVSSKPIEQAWLNADNPYVILQHLPCAAYEHPLREDEPLFKTMAYSEGVEVLKENKTVVPYDGGYRYALQDYPSRGVNLRGMTNYNVEIYCGSEVIGELDPIGARGTLYKDAIYQHLGKRYMSMDLDLEKKLCRVELVDVDYYTEAVWESRVEMSDCEETAQHGDAEVKFGYIHVNRQPKLYKKIRERSYENIGYGPITLPPFEYDTTGFSISFSKVWEAEMKKHDVRFIGAGIHGLAYMMKLVAPSLCMGDRGDIETDVSLMHQNEAQWESALYLFDSIEGGVGYGEKIFENLTKAFDLCLAILQECECDHGCPACVPTMPPGVEDEALTHLMIESNAAVACTESLLIHWIEGRIVRPEIKEVQMPLSEKIEPEPVDEQRLKMRRRLGKAADILKKHREREH